MRVIFEADGKIEDIIATFQREGYKTGAEVVRMALIYTFENKFKRQNESIKGKDEKGSYICKQLNGKIVGNICHYTIYEKLNDKYVESFGAEVALSDLRQSHVDDQFKPSKKECDKVPGFEAN